MLEYDPEMEPDIEGRTLSTGPVSNSQQNDGAFAAVSSGSCVHQSASETEIQGEGQRWRWRLTKSILS